MAGSAARIERCEAASQVAAVSRPLRQQQAARAERYLLLQRVHVQPQHQRACAHGTRTPAGGAPRGPGRPWRVAAAPELPMPWARAVLWARRRGSSMCPDRLILYAKCAFRIWCALTCAFRICPTENHAGIPPGCALTCALKNRAYGASVPAGGVFLQGQNYGMPLARLGNFFACFSL